MSVTETILYKLGTRIDIWDHELKIFTFTAEENPLNYVKELDFLEVAQDGQKKK